MHWIVSFVFFIRIFIFFSFCMMAILYSFCAIMIQLQIYAYTSVLSSPYYWFLRLFTILLCYALIYIPISILRRISSILAQQWETETSSLAYICRKCIVVCFLNHLPTDRPLLDVPSNAPKSSLAAQLSTRLAEFAKEHRWLALIGCTFGLNFVYVMWGIFQVVLLSIFYKFISILIIFKLMANLSKSFK